MNRAGFIRFLVVAVAIVVLEIACRASLIDPITIIPPSGMAAGAWKLIVSGRYTEDILLTLGSVALAAMLAIVGGFGLGYCLFRLPRLRRALDPLLASYYA
ncbi:MAG: ABC transporter permease, partial [Pseudolabrys sp.]